MRTLAIVIIASIAVSLMVSLTMVVWMDYGRRGVVFLWGAILGTGAIVWALA